jgi:hypothetical protein
MSIQEVTIKFHMTYGKLTQRGDDLEGSGNRDFDTIKNYGITRDHIDNIGHLKSIFLATGTDVEYGSTKVGKTQFKDQKATEVRLAIRQIIRRVGLKYPKYSWQYKKFHHGDLTKLDDSKLCRAAGAIVRAATDMLTDLQSHGLTLAIINALKTVNDAFDVAIDEQHEAEKARDKATQERRIAANNFYDAMMIVSNAGKAAFEDTDEALYNDYVIYPTPTGKKIKKGTGMLTGEATNQDGVPEPGVTITVKGTTCVAVTDEHGQYVVEDIPLGTYTVEASKTGFTSSSIDDITIIEGKALELDFDLEQEGT